MTGPLHVDPPAHVGGVVFTDVWICAALALLTLCAMYVIKTVWFWVAASWGAASTITVPLPVAVDWLAGTSCVDRKSTRLNSSHVEISYAVFCLKKKKKTATITLVSLNVASW